MLVLLSLVQCPKHKTPNRQNISSDNKVQEVFDTHPWTSLSAGDCWPLLTNAIHLTKQISDVENIFSTQRETGMPVSLSVARMPHVCQSFARSSLISLRYLPWWGSDFSVGEISFNFTEGHRRSRSSPAFVQVLFCVPYYCLSCIVFDIGWYWWVIGYCMAEIFKFFIANPYLTQFRLTRSRFWMPYTSLTQKRYSYLMLKECRWLLLTILIRYLHLTERRQDGRTYIYWQHCKCYACLERAKWRSCVLWRQTDRQTNE